MADLESSKAAFEDELRKSGLSNVAISAWMSRFNSESAFDPNARRKDDAGPGKDSIGIGQWNQGRAGALFKFAQKEGLPWNDPRLQARFAISEINGTHKFVGDRFKTAKTLQDAVDAAVMYENPRGASHRDQDGKTVWTPRNAIAYKKTLDNAELYYKKTNPDAINIMSNATNQMDTQQADTSAAPTMSQTNAKLIADSGATLHDNGAINPDDIASLVRSYLPTSTTTPAQPKLIQQPGLAEASQLFQPRIQWQGL